MVELGNLAGTDGAEWIGRPPHEDLQPKARPLLPTDDPFYRPPSGFQHSEPGTVLRSRDVELAFLGLIPQPVSAIQLLYRTMDLNGQPEACVTTVIVPAERAPGQTCPLLSYQCAIDAMSSRCFPSYALRRRAKALGSIAQLELFLIAAAVAEGWAVSVPDHEGLLGMWGAPYEPGYRTLDGIRAARNSDRVALSPSAPVGLWGYSGGGLASAWAAEMTAEYAPELNIVGAVLGSPVGNPESVARRLTGSFFAGLAALMIAALIQVFPDAQQVVDRHATEEGKRLLEELQTMTTASAVWRLRKMNIGSYVDMSADELWDLPEVRNIFDETKLGKSAPAMPVLVVQAVHDNIISVEDVDKLVATYTRGGTAVTYHRDGFCDHLLLHPLSAPMTLRWLRDRFARRPLAEQRLRTKWPTLFNPSTYLGMLKLGVISAKVIAGRSIDRHPLSTTDVPCGSERYS